MFTLNTTNTIAIEAFILYINIIFRFVFFSQQLQKQISPDMVTYFPRNSLVMFSKPTHECNTGLFILFSYLLQISQILLRNEAIFIFLCIFVRMCDFFFIFLMRLYPSYFVYASFLHPLSNWLQSTCITNVEPHIICGFAWFLHPNYYWLFTLIWLKPPASL